MGLPVLPGFALLDRHEARARLWRVVRGFNLAMQSGVGGFYPVRDAGPDRVVTRIFYPVRESGASPPAASRSWRSLVPEAEVEGQGARPAVLEALDAASRSQNRIRLTDEWVPALVHVLADLAPAPTCFFYWWEGTGPFSSRGEPLRLVVYRGSLEGLTSLGSMFGPPQLWWPPDLAWLVTAHVDDAYSDVVGSRDLGDALKRAASLDVSDVTAATTLAARSGGNPLEYLRHGIAERTDLFRSESADGWDTLRMRLADDGLDPSKCLIVKLWSFLGGETEGLLLDEGGHLRHFLLRSRPPGSAARLVTWEAVSELPDWTFASAELEVARVMQREATP